MYKRILCILICSWVMNIQAQNPIDTLKIMTFNVYGAPDSEWPTRLVMILDELEKQNPDVICLQEIVETPGSQGADNRVKIFADSLYERTGITYNYTWQRTHYSWSTFDEGIAIMSPHIILAEDFIDLPRGLFARKSLWSKILSPAGVVNIFNTHLSHGDQEEVRIEQVNAIKDFISIKSNENMASANILCGDFNAIPSSPPIHLLTQEDLSGTVYLDSWDNINPSDPGFTIPSDHPDARIDYVLLKNSDKTEILTSKQVLKSPNQDNIFPSDHIGVLSSFNTHIYPLGLEIQYPGADDEIAGTVEISWSKINKTEDLTYKIFISRDAGESWQTLWQGQSISDSYIWNTLQHPDGANYLLRMAAMGDTSFSLDQLDGTFIVNNPGNAEPELNLKSPRGAESIKNIFEVKWEAKDADSDVLTVSIEYSIDNGSTWNPIAENLENTGSYLWDTNLVSNSPNYILKVICADDSVFVSESSKIFSIVNHRVEMPKPNFLHIEGNGGGSVYGNAFDPGQLSGHVYRVTFNDSIPGQKTYSVFDKQTEQFVLEDATEMDGVTEGPPFDGVRLIISDYKAAQKDDANSGWIVGNTNLKHTISLPVLGVGNEIIYGFPYPADYKITIYDQVVDTSSTYLNLPATPMMFNVYNITGNYQVDILYLENDTDHKIGPLDQIYFLEKDTQGNPMITWRIAFSNITAPILPQPGDEFILATLKPFTNDDVFEFKSSLTGLDNLGDNSPISFRLAQNYPNPFNPTTVIGYQLSELSQVELIIYDILGQKVTTLVDKKQNAGRYLVEWSASGYSSGIYFYRLSTEKGHIESRKLILMK